nr:biofilm-associated surface protein [Pseudomonas plecoglossicida NB2011]
MAGSISALDAIYADIAGFEFVEVDDGGNYISWERFVEQLKRIVDINETATKSISFGGVYGLPKRVLKHGDTYIAAFDGSYVIFNSAQQLAEGTARIVEKNYISDRACDVFKTELGTYYLRGDNGADRLTGIDGTDTRLTLDIAGAFGDTRLPAMATLGGKDWLVNTDFSISYLIDSDSLQVTPGPVLDDVTLLIDGTGNEVVSSGGRVFASIKRPDATTAVVELTAGGYTLISEGGGKLVAGDDYLYILYGQDVRRVDYNNGSEKLITLDSAVTSGYARGDFAVFLNADVSLTVTYDAGATFEKIFPVEGDSSLKWLDVEDNSLVLTRNYRDFDLLEYKLVEE